MSLNILRNRLANPTTTNLARSRLGALSTQIARAQLPTSSFIQTSVRTMSSVPSKMKVTVVTEKGGPDKLKFVEDHPVPELKDGETLVRNDLAGINYIDTYFRTGLYPSPTGFPLILGQEAAGKVAAIKGDNPYGLKEGDRVVYMKQGSYAEYTSISSDRVIKIPEGVSDQDAIGGFLMGMTALSLVQEAYTVKPGDVVLLHAAAGGVGQLLCQILRDIGATTIATAGGPEKCAIAKQNGATHVIDYRATSGPSWEEQVQKLTNGNGVDVVFDSVGQDTWEGSLNSVKRKGKVVYFGNASGPVPSFNIQKLAANNVSVMRATVMRYIVTREELEHYANGVLGMIKDGKLKVGVYKIYDLKDAAQAHIDLEGRKTTGKLLIKC